MNRPLTTFHIYLNKWGLSHLIQESKQDLTPNYTYAGAVDAVDPWEAYMIFIGKR